MYRIMVVDDEYYIRDGLCNVVDWASIGAQVVGDVTREIYRALRLVNIQLLEHLIFADNEFLSFVQSNYMDSIRQSVQD